MAVRSAGHPVRGARRPEKLARFTLFAECLLTGVWITLAALPLVTLLPACAAGCAHLRRHLDGRRGGLREFAADLREAVTTGWRASLLCWAALALLVFDWQVARSGLLPGGRLLAAVSVLGLLALAVAALRTAAAWRSGAAWAPLVRGTARRTLTDPAGSLLLIGGFVALALTTWQVPPLAAPALGALAAAAVAVDRR
ncbi:hypothetical protein OG230_06055 [Streptomyces sp. NBC_00234]|uniref:hypothetical protein n=1 Tax=Streptomyces sp. NBC_00234 TaxID=2903638 RepID=UPI002E2E33A2|nr:hypothetical protein [Streptomyces sp. NBC_00234]